MQRRHYDCTTPQHVILFRLRTGHNRLYAHMHSKFRVGESKMCPCNADIMTAEQLLQHCQLHDALRRDMWPEPMSLRVKLYDNLEELRRTATFGGRQTSPSSARRRRSLPVPISTRMQVVGYLRTGSEGGETSGPETLPPCLKYFTSQYSSCLAALSLSTTGVDLWFSMLSEAVMGRLWRWYFTSFV